MLNSSRKFLIVALIFASGCAPSLAAFDQKLSEECDPIRFKTLDISESKRTELLGIINLITEDSNKEFQQEAKLGVTIPADMPLTLNGEFKDFEKSRVIVNRQYNYNYTQEETQAWFRTQISPEYGKCVEGYIETRNAPGLYIEATGGTATAVTLTVKWVPQPGNKERRFNIRSTGTDSVSKNRLVLDPNGTDSFVAKFKRGAEVRIIVTNDKGISTQIDLLPPPIIMKGCKELNAEGTACLFCETTFDGNLILSNFDTPYQEICANMPLKTKIKARFINGRYTVTNMDSRLLSCATQDMFAGPDEKWPPKGIPHDQLNTPAQCSNIPFAGESGFVTPRKNGVGTANLRVGCSYGPTSTGCRMMGTIQIYTADAHPTAPKP